MPWNPHVASLACDEPVQLGDLVRLDLAAGRILGTNPIALLARPRPTGIIGGAWWLFSVRFALKRLVSDEAWILRDAAQAMASRTES